MYGVPAIPAQVIIDRNGKIVATTDGYRPGDPRLEAALAAAGIEVDATVVARAGETKAKITGVRATATTAGLTTARATPPPFTEDAIRLKAGTVLADLAVRDAADAEKKISEYRGKPVVLSFSQAESIPSDWLNQAVEKYGALGVEVECRKFRCAESSWPSNPCSQLPCTMAQRSNDSAGGKCISKS